MLTMPFRFAGLISSLLLLLTSLYSNSAAAWHFQNKAAHTSDQSRVMPGASMLIFQYEDRFWQIDLSLLGFDGVDPSTVNRDALNEQLEIIAQVNRQPQNAYFNHREIVPHKNGLHVDRDQLYRLANQLVWNQNKILTLPVIEIEPELTTHTLTRLTEKVLGRYTTSFNPYNTPRVANLTQSSRSIDYVIVQEGEVFSFNEIVGPRTRERGYHPAPIIVRGEYSEGVGGGICQTSSTLFNSVDQAGLEIVERTVHSKRVTYVPKGRDATVSWGGPDFKFKNNINRPILIICDVQDGQMTITVSSMKDARFQPNDIPPPPNENGQQMEMRSANHH